MEQALLQRQLSHNRRTITKLLDTQQVLRRTEKKLFRKSHITDPKTYQYFVRLNVVRDSLRKISTRLQLLAELQIILKKAIRGN
jgi:hypothetical protein